MAALLVGIYTRKSIRATTRESLKAGLILGLLLGGGFALQTIGLESTTASNAGILTGTLVVFTPLLQLLIERRPPTAGNLGGVLIVGLGLYIFTSPEGTAFGSGDLLVLGCAVVFAFHVVYLDVFTKTRFDPEIVFYQFVVTSAVGFALWPILPSRQSDINASVVLSIAYLAVFASAFALYVLSKYQRETTPTRAAIIYTMEPVMAAGIAALFLGESLTVSGIIGAVIMVTGLLVSELSNAFVRSRTAQHGGSE